MTSYWVRIYVNEADRRHFCYHGPWWVSGYAGDGSYEILCLAVRARDEVHATAIVEAAFDARHKPREFSFVNSRPAAWTPFSDRFERREWMQWPEVTGRNERASKAKQERAYA